ncbi:NAD(P)H-binding protein [Paenibacillus sp. SYP-B4298]|uniref:NAD(P)H-binding protein n=1 Tax=Paenibacillus sp. SYP-B4298 TaxID=2996034 RepID=UPI0022DD9C3C|nr:NAD(P)H-binding protein [Paenibacillus sp. SYP-B4298]
MIEKKAHSTGATAVVAGATGLIGQELVQQLLEHPAYSQVVALVRRELGMSHPKLLQQMLSFDQLEDEVEGRWLQGADVYCALGTTIKKAGSQEAFRRVDYTYPLALGRAARRHDAACLVIVTAMGASARSNIFYSRVKGEVERDLSALKLKRLVVMRPSLLLGERAEKRPGEHAASAAYRLLGGLMIGPLAKYKAIEGREVARAMIAAARRAGSPFEVLESQEIAALASDSVASP